nr:hypothetical protein KitaXyl93_00250 [Kitasatospora sp. Xyl93]
MPWKDRGGVVAAVATVVWTADGRVVAASPVPVAATDAARPRTATALVRRLRFEVVFTGTILPGPAAPLDHAGFRLEGGTGYTKIPAARSP